MPQALITKDSERAKQLDALNSDVSFQTVTGQGATQVRALLWDRAGDRRRSWCHALAPTRELALDAVLALAQSEDRPAWTAAEVVKERDALAEKNAELQAEIDRLRGTIQKGSQKPAPGRSQRRRADEVTP